MIKHHSINMGGIRMKIKVLVVFGGVSVEHEISILSAIYTMHSFDLERYEIIPLYLTKNYEMYSEEAFMHMHTYRNIDEYIKKLEPVQISVKNNRYYITPVKRFSFKKEKEFDLVFPIMHGTNGEDGSIQGYFKILGIPCCMSPINAAVMCQNKGIMKDYMNYYEIPVVPYTIIHEIDQEEVIYHKLDTLGYPCMIKPCNLGSSIGIIKINNKEEAYIKCKEAFQYDTSCIVESFLERIEEYNIAVLGDEESCEVSSIEKIEKEHAFFSYEDKYGKKEKQGNTLTQRTIPALLEKEIQEEIEQYAKQCFQIFQCRGVIRIDIMMDQNTKQIYINEINTIPGSLAYYLWETKEQIFSKLLDKIIWIERKHYRKESRKIVSYSDNILKNWDLYDKSGKKINTKL